VEILRGYKKVREDEELRLRLWTKLSVFSITINKVSTRVRYMLYSNR
jgi:hypothetical protein